MRYRLSYKYIRPRVGAPPGLTVHWLISELAGDFTRAYKLSYNIKNHNYHFARFNKRTLIDEFIVIRTSKRCYRVMYFNDEFKHFQYFSAQNYRDCAAQMISIFNVFKQIEKKPKPTKNENPEKEVIRSLSELKSEDKGNCS